MLNSGFTSSSSRPGRAALARFAAGFLFVALIVMIWIPLNGPIYTFEAYLRHPVANLTELACIAGAAIASGASTTVCAAMIGLIRYQNGYVLPSWAIHSAGIISTFYLVLFVIVIQIALDPSPPGSNTYIPPHYGQALFAEYVGLWLPFGIQSLTVLSFAGLALIRCIPSWANKVRVGHALLLGIPMVVSTIVICIVALAVWGTPQ